MTTKFCTGQQAVEVGGATYRVDTYDFPRSGRMFQVLRKMPATERRGWHWRTISGQPAIAAVKALGLEVNAKQIIA